MQKFSADNLGAKLKYERERQGVSVRDIAQQLRLSEGVLYALEGDQYDNMPSAVYVRGYIRAYCQILNMDSDALLAQSGTKIETLVDDSLILTTREKTHHLIRIWGTLVVISVMVLLVSWWWITQRGQEYLSPNDQSTVEQQEADETMTSTDINDPIMPIAPSASALPEASASVSTTSELISPLPTAEAETNRSDQQQANTMDELTLYSDELCWVYIEDGRGDVLIHSELDPGIHQTISGYAPFEIRIGRASVLTFWVNQQLYNLNQHHVSSLDTLFFQLNPERE